MLCTYLSARIFAQNIFNFNHNKCRISFAGRRNFDGYPDVCVIIPSLLVQSQKLDLCRFQPLNKSHTVSIRIEIKYTVHLNDFGSSTRAIYSRFAVSAHVRAFFVAQLASECLLSPSRTSRLCLSAALMNLDAAAGFQATRCVCIVKLLRPAAGVQFWKTSCAWQRID